MGKHTGLTDSWKTLIVFFFQKPRKSKNALYYSLMHSPESFSNIKSKFHNFLGEDGSKYIAKNYFCTQNVVRNVYMNENEFTISLRNWSKSLKFCWKTQKMQPPKMTFRSQLEPSIKSYECFMFLENFRLEITLDWWILERV